MKLLLLAFLSCFLYSSAFAQSRCASLFMGQSESNTAAQDFLLPRELHIKPDFLNYVIGTPYEPLIRSLSNIYENLSRSSYYYLPIIIKKSAEFKTRELLSPQRQDANLWGIDTRSEPFRRAYSALKGVTLEELKRLFEGVESNGTVEKIQWDLTETDLILFAHLLAKGVPAEPSESITVSDGTLTPFSKRLRELAGNRRFVPILYTLVREGIEMSYVSSRYQEKERQLENRTGVVHDTFERIQQLTEKLKAGRVLGNQDFLTLQAVFFKTFMTTVERSYFMGGSVSNKQTTVKRNEFLRQLNKTIDLYTLNNPFFKMFTEDMLTYLFLGERVAPYADKFDQIITSAAISILLPAKNEFAQAKARLAQQANSSSGVPAASPVVVEFNGSLGKDPFAPPPVKTREKTRGKADDRAENVSDASPEQAMSRTIEQLIEIGPVQWGIALEPDVVYQVQFERQYGQFNEKQNFVFSKDVVIWLNDHSETGLQLMEAIQLGISRQGTGQDGVKMLAHVPRNYSGGRLYEVKSADKYRIVLVHQDELWIAIAVKDKDHFDAFIRTL